MDIIIGTHTMSSLGARHRSKYLYIHSCSPHNHRGGRRYKQGKDKLTLNHRTKCGGAGTESGKSGSELGAVKYNTLISG